MPHLKQLPNHQGLQHRANATRCHNVRIGREHELVQTGEKCAVFKRLADKGIHILLERQIDTNADALCAGAAFPAKKNVRGGISTRGFSRSRL